jgi:hypothetical protein
MPIHALRRTSPKGEAFIGTCVRCLKRGLSLDEVWADCPNTEQLSEEDAVMVALGLSVANEASKA